MALSTQLGLPVTARRAVWAGAAGVLTSALLIGAGKKIFDSVMIGAFVVGFTTCVPLTLASPDTA